MRIKCICSCLAIILLFTFCNKKGDENASQKKYTKFSGDYKKTFNDLHDLHAEAAASNGVGPLNQRGDTTLFNSKLVYIPQELEIYKTDKLKHSIPYLVPKASELLSDICFNFRDSLIRKKMALYKPIVTSITRTDDDVTSLSKRNVNASDNSAHRYGTTFDIAWTRFAKIDPTDERTLDDGQLKAVLGQVLHDLRQRGRCYIKHEQKQSCFHITVR